MVVKQSEPFVEHELVHESMTENPWDESVSVLMDSQATDFDPMNLDMPYGRQVWDQYHLIGDVMRNQDLAFQPSEMFYARLSQAIEQEPAHQAKRQSLWPWGLSLAASLVLSVGVWIYSVNQGPDPVSVNEVSAPIILTQSMPAPIQTESRYGAANTDAAITETANTDPAQLEVAAAPMAGARQVTQATQGQATQEQATQDVQVAQATRARTGLNASARLDKSAIAMESSTVAGQTNPASIGMAIPLALDEDKWVWVNVANTGQPKPASYVNLAQEREQGLRLSADQAASHPLGISLPSASSLGLNYSANLLSTGNWRENFKTLMEQHNYSIGTQLANPRQLRTGALP